MATGMGSMGVYRIGVTEWEAVRATAQIGEAWLLPVLEAMLEQFPFRIRGFHSDNSSEFINHTVAAAMEIFYEQSFNPYLNFHRP